MHFSLVHFIICIFAVRCHVFLKLASDPLPLQQPSAFIIYYHTTHMHTGACTYTFIIYCGNVLNAWFNTGTQIHCGEGTGMGWESGLGSCTHTNPHTVQHKAVLTYLHYLTSPYTLYFHQETYMYTNKCTHVSVRHACTDCVTCQSESCHADLKRGGRDSWASSSAHCCP